MKQHMKNNQSFKFTNIVSRAIESDADQFILEEKILGVSGYDVRRRLEVRCEEASEGGKLVDIKLQAKLGKLDNTIDRTEKTAVTLFKNSLTLEVELIRFSQLITPIEKAWPTTDVVLPDSIRYGVQATCTQLARKQEDQNKAKVLSAEAAAKKQADELAALLS